MTESQNQNIKKETKAKNLWAYFIPLTFFMLSLVLIFQNILLNKKLDALSAKVTSTINSVTSANADLFSNLEQKLSELGKTTGDSKSLEKLEELKGLMQDIRGLSLDGSVSASTSDIIVDEVKPATATTATTTQEVPSDNTQEKQFTTNSGEYVKELDKISETLTNRQKNYDDIITDINTVTEKLISGTQEVTTTEVTGQGILKKFVKVKKAGELDDTDLPDLLKTAREKFQNGNVKECTEIFQKINLTKKDEDISKLLEKLKIFEINALDYNLLISKLKSVIQNLKGE